MKNNRVSKVKNVILLAIVIAFLIAIIGGTYSRFISSGNVNSSASVAKWHIVLSDGTSNSDSYDISSESKTFAIDAVPGDNSQNVAEGKLAPGKNVVASLEVDPTGSEVAVDYQLDIDFSNVSGFGNARLSISNAKYSLDGGEDQDLLVDTSTGKYTYEESLQDVLAGKKVTFKVYISWDNLGTSNGNSNDSSIGANSTSITIPMSVTAKQHLEDHVLAKPTLLTATYKNSQVLDSYRSPAYPKAGDAVTIGGFNNSYRYNGNHNGVPEGHYLKFTDLGTISTLADAGLKSYMQMDYPNKDYPVVRLDEYDENGTNIGMYSQAGVLYLLSEERGIYLFVASYYNSDNSYGYIVCLTEEEALSLRNAGTATLTASGIVESL